jgi:DNA mismatch endonuclease (patch repair protein)
MERRLREHLPGGSFGKVAPGDVQRMKAVRGKNNKTTERRFRALLIGAGVRGWKVRPKGLPGSPDFLFPDAHLVVFLDGCYWHACPRCGHVPRVNQSFWATKLERNRERDREKERLLIEAGFRVIRFWEHELAEGAGECLRRLRIALSRPGDGP